MTTGVGVAQTLRGCEADGDGDAVTEVADDETRGANPLFVGLADAARAPREPLELVVQDDERLKLAVPVRALAEDVACIDDARVIDPLNETLGYAADLCKERVDEAGVSS